MSMFGADPESLRLRRDAARAAQDWAAADALKQELLEAHGLVVEDVAGGSSRCVPVDQMKAAKAAKSQDAQRRQRESQLGQVNAATERRRTRRNRKRRRHSAAQKPRSAA